MFRDVELPKGREDVGIHLEGFLMHARWKGRAEALGEAECHRIDMWERSSILTMSLDCSE